MTAPLGLAEGVERVHEEAGGMLQVCVILYADAPAIMARALAGEGEASRIVGMVSKVLDGIQRAPRRKPMLCGSCPGPLRDGRYSIALALPARDDPTQGLALAICNRCGTSREAVEEKAYTALRRIWPNLQPITIMHGAAGKA